MNTDRQPTTSAPLPVPVDQENARRKRMFKWVEAYPKTSGVPHVYLASVRDIERGFELLRQSGTLGPLIDDGSEP